jgi:N4-(beta-N-acetylglucosaminyl)-L-asparaginase
MHPNKKRYAAIFLSQFIWNINGERNFLLGKQVVINTWPFTNATNTAYKVLEENLHPQTAVLDAITKGCNRCEIDQCDFTVGYGGSPDTAGETTLDAMIIDGKTLNMGVVARLRKIKPAIEVARAVMEHSSHTILAGDGALQFAKMMGFKEESLETPDSKRMYQQWKDNHCQPNYFINVVNQSTSCPPYQPISDPTFGADNTLESRDRLDAEARISSRNHDTIGMLVLGNHGRMAAGTSSNGANHKIAG